MTDPDMAELRRLLVIIWRVRLGRWAFVASRALADLGERLLPDDLRA